MATSVTKWVCRCGGFSLDYRATGAIPIELAAPCCGDTLKVEGEDVHIPPRRPNLKVVE